MGIELGIGESLLLKAIGESTGRNLSTIKSDLKKEGDLGLVAMVFSFLVTMSLWESHPFIPALQKQPEDVVQT